MNGAEIRYIASDIFVASGVTKTPIADYPATVKHREHVTLVRLQITSLYDWHKELWCACMWDHDVSNGEQSTKLAVWGNPLAALGRLRWYGTAYQRPFDLAWLHLLSLDNAQNTTCRRSHAPGQGSEWISFSRRTSGGEVRM